MNDSPPTYQELVEEVSVLKQRILELEGAEADLRHGEEELKVSGHRLQLLIDAGPDFFFFKDPELRYQLINEANARFFGRDKADILGRTDKELMPPDTAQACEESDRKVMEERNAVVSVERVGDRLYETYKFPVITESGVIGVGGIVRDITERKRTEEALRAVEARYHLLFEHAPVGIVSINPATGHFREFNEAAHRQLGYSREEFAALRIFDVEAGESREETARHMKSIARDGGSDFETLHRTRHGAVRNVHVTARSMDIAGHGTLNCAVWRDITERRQAEEALRKSEARFKEIFETIEDLYYETDHEGIIVALSPSVQRLTGWSEGDLIGKPATMVYVEEGSRGQLLRDLAEKGYVHDYQLILKKKDGEGRRVSLSARLLVDNKGQPAGVRGLLRDITDRKRTEEALRKSEETLRAFFDAVHESMFLVDREGGVILCSAVGAERLGKTAAGLAGTNLYDHLPPEVARYRKKQCDQLIAERKPVFFEDIRSDRSFEHYCYPVLDKEGEVSAIAIFARDVTERKRSLEALEESEERYRTVVEHSKDGIAIIGGGVHIYVNRRFLDMFGYESAEEVLDKPHSATVHPDDLEWVTGINQRRQAGEVVPSTYEFKGMKKDGTPIYIDVSATRIMYKGSYDSLVFLRDVSDRKKAEDALKKAEEKYRSIFENAIEGLFQTTPDGRYISVNPALARMQGYASPEEMIHAVADIGMEQYVNPEDRKRFMELLNRQGFVNGFETEACRRDGGKIWISMTARAIRGADGHVIHFEGSAEDITARKKADEERMTAHQRLLDIIEFLPDPTAVIDREKKVVAWNRAMEGVTGVRKEDIIGKGNYVYAVPFYGERRPVLIDLVFESDKEGYKRYDYVEKDGDVLVAEVYAPMVYQGKGAYMSVRASSLLDGSGNIMGAIESLRDITEQKRITRELQESEERYRTAIENSNDAVVMIKDERRIYANRKFLEMFGFDSMEQALEQPVGLVTHPEDRERIVEMNRRRQLGEKVPEQYEFKGIRTNGDAVFIECSSTRTSYQGEPITLVYLRDITARKHLEAQLLQSQKMEAIGTLAGGIAHDFNNILTAVIGYGSLLQMGMGNDPRRLYVDQILSSSQKAAQLTQSLLAFSRKQVIELKPRKINEIVREMKRLLKRLLTEDIEFTVILREPDMTVEADITQMDQVLMNLATNARDAMPMGGKLTIEVGPFHLDHYFFETHGFGRPGDYALVSVSDTGAGMDQATQEKIFEPFFTTKEVGKGTGLGLSIVYGIVKQHNGYITVLSEPGKGTKVDVYLPIAEMAAAQAKQTRVHAKGGSETILVAEDNDDVRNLAKQVLTSNGYAVIEAVDGGDAVRLFMEHRDKIAFLLLDVVMPGKNGKEAYEEIRRVKPDVKVLFMSGYTGDVVLSKGIDDEAIDYIQKPLTPHELLTKVREVIDAAKKQNKRP